VSKHSRQAEDRFEYLKHCLPGQAPIRDFVHHNTLHAFESLPFPKALAEASRFSGASGYLTEDRFREFFAHGRISREDLVAVFRQHLGESFVCGVSNTEILLASFTTSLTPIPPSLLTWCATEQGVLDTPEGLWKACIETLEISSNEKVREQTVSEWSSPLDRLGRDWTLRDLLLFLTGEDIFESFRPILIRHLAAYLDHGIAFWKNSKKGFYSAWRASATVDLSWTLEGQPYIRRALLDLPESSEEVLEAELTHLGLPKDRWERYLECLALELPGWSGMFLRSSEIQDYLAVRLVLEKIYADALCRRHWKIEACLSEFEKISFSDQPKQPFLPRICNEAWPLFQLTQRIGLTPRKVCDLGRAGVESLLAVLNSLDQNTRGYLWLCAYERHYREEILSALAANPVQNIQETPKAQWVFCMDDREEGLRRHLEAIDPRHETLGAAAHFNVPHFWKGLTASTSVALAPVVPEPVIPTHEVQEQTRLKDNRAIRRYAFRRRVALAFHKASRRGVFTPALLTSLFAPLAMVALAARTIDPGRWDRFLKKMAVAFDGPAPTSIVFTATQITKPVQIGFTDVEQADRVQAFLKSNGLTRNFAPWVIVVGHASHSLNNPHASAYNCGACAGRYSGPNARLVAAMANQHSVRTLLAERGILIPGNTWFLGADHDTCTDQVAWFDLEDLPTGRNLEFDILRSEIDEACRAHAQERCRRFVSAPEEATPALAWRHVADRAADLGQARPELGHATNACAFFGRRSMSRGAFFDRRAFLISYDPIQDPNGTVLEQHLLINGAVGAGINLEYYFSTVDNDRYGCGSKVTHNLTGLFGVMDGASSDLRTGLPKQMIEIHEAMRLLVVIEQETDLITKIYQRQPPLQKLVGNEWVVLAAKSPSSGTLHLFDPKHGWVLWQSRLN